MECVKIYGESDSTRFIDFCTNIEKKYVRYLESLDIYFFFDTTKGKLNLKMAFQIL